MSEVNKFGGDVKVYLNSNLYGINDYNRGESDLKYPEEHDNINRLGKDWNSFNISLSSKIKKIIHKDIISFDIDNFYLKNKIENEIPEFIEIDFRKLFSYLFESYNFIYDIFDKNGNKIKSSDFSVRTERPTDSYGEFKNFIYLYFSFKENIVESYETIKIRMFLTESHREKNICFYECSENLDYSRNLRLDSDYIFPMYQFFPVLLYDENNNVLKNVKYFYERNGNEGQRYYNDFNLYIYPSDKSFLLNYSCYKIRMILGIDTTINFSDIKYKNDSLCLVNPNELNKYLYFCTQEIKDYTYEIDSLNNIIKLYGICNFKNIDYSYEKNKFKLTFDTYEPSLDTHILDIDNNCRFFGDKPGEEFLNDDIINIIPTEKTIIISDKSIISNKITIKKSELLESDGIRIVNVDQKLKSIKLDDTLYNSNEFSFNWQTNLLNITFTNNVENKNIKKIELTFEYLVLNYKKTKLDIYKGKDVHPFITLFEDDKEIKNNFYYIYNRKNGEDLSLYFRKTPDKTKKYKIQIIDYNKIYDFDLVKTNYFGNKTGIKVTSFSNYDFDMQMNNMFIIMKDDEHKLCFSKIIQPENFNLYLHEDEISLDNFNYLNTIENRNYNIEIKWLYDHNNFKKMFSLKNENIEKNYNIIDERNLGILEYPLINFYGNFVDSFGNSISKIPEIQNKFPNDKIISKLEDNTKYPENYINYSNNKSFLKNESIFSCSKIRNDKRIKLVLTNLNKNLSSDLVYDSSICYNNDDKNDMHLTFDLFTHESDFEFVQTYKFRKYEGGRYSSKKDLEKTSKNNISYNTYVNKGIYPGKYNVKLFLDNDEIIDYGDFEFTKENEKLGKFYDKKLKWPYINIIGKVVNKARNNEIIHKNGMIIRFTNNLDNKKYDFKYYSDKPDYEDFTGQTYFGLNYTWNWYSSSLSNWTKYFKFLFQGFKKYPITLKNNNYLESENKSINKYEIFDGIYSSSSIPSGFYRLDLLDENENLIENYYENFEISEKIQNELYNLELEFPLCKVTGKLIILEDGNEKVVHEKEWSILMENINNPDDSVNFKYTVYNEEYKQYKDYFEFNGLGRDRHYNPNPNTSNRALEGTVYEENKVSKSYTEGIKFGSTYYSKGLRPGNYKIHVYYKNLEIPIVSNIKTLDVSKEHEAAGELDDIILKVNSIVSNVSGTIINDQFNEKIYKEDSFKLKLLEENYDGNIKDDFLDDTKTLEKISKNGEFVFNKIPILGKYKFDLNTYSWNGKLASNEKYIIPSTIKNYEDKNIFILSGNSELSNPSANMIDLKGYTLMNIHVPYWWSPMYKEYNYIDEYNEYITPPINLLITFDNLNTNENFIENSNKFGSTYSSDEFKESNLLKTGNYKINLNLNTNINLYSENYLLKGSTPEEYNKKGLTIDKLKCVTLNTNLLFFNKETNTYEILKNYKNNCNYNNIIKTSISYKNNLNFENYYSTEENFGKTCLNYYYIYINNNFKDESIINEYNEWVENNNSKIMFKQHKQNFQCLYNNYDYKINIKYGGNFDENLVKFKGLYKFDISKNFKNKHDINYEILDKLTLKSVIKTYVMPSVCNYLEKLKDDETLVPQNLKEEFKNVELSSIINSAYSEFELKIGSTFNTEFKFGDIISDEIENKLNIKLNEINKFFPERTIKSYLNEESLTNLLENKMENDFTFNPSIIKLKNNYKENETSNINYYSLLVEEFKSNIYANIKYDDNGNIRYHDFSKFNIILYLSIYDESGNIEFEDIPNRGYFFFIVGIKSGYHTFKINIHNKCIYEKRIYIHSCEDIDLIIDGNMFTNVPVKGHITFNGSKSINRIHTVIYNEDLKSIWYSGSCFGVNDTGYSSTTKEYFYTRSYSFNTNEDDKNFINFTPEPNRYQGIAFKNMILNKYEFEYDEKIKEGRYIDYIKYFNLNKYGNSEKMNFGEYRLYDLIPGNYKIKYFLVPNKVEDMYTYEFFDWKNGLDTYYKIKLLDKNSDEDIYQTDEKYSNIDLNDLLINKKEIIIKKMDVLNKIININQIDISKIKPMRVSLNYTAKYNKKSFLKNYDIALTNKENKEEWYKFINWVELNFSFIEDEIEIIENNQTIKETVYKIKIENTKTPFKDIKNQIIDFKYNSIDVGFGIEIFEKTFNITKETTNLETLDLSYMYSQKLIFNITNIPENLLYGGQLYIILYDEHNNLINRVEDFMGMNTRIEFYGLKNGIYHGKLTQSNSENSDALLSFDNIIVDKTINEYELNIKTYNLNLSFYDASLNNSKIIISSKIGLKKLTKDINDHKIHYDSQYKSDNYNYLIKGLNEGTYELCLFYPGRSNEETSFYGVKNEEYSTILYESPLDTIVVNDNITKDIILPYQLFRITINFYDAKAMKYIYASEAEGMELSLTRTSSNDNVIIKAYNTSNSSISKNNIKSGNYTNIKYTSISDSLPDGENTMIITYKDLLLDNDNTKFTLYKNISIIMGSDDDPITITIYEKTSSNGESVTQNCINKFVNIYDENSNLIDTTIDRSNNHGVINLTSLMSIKYKFGIEGEPYISNTYEIISELNKNIKLIIDSSEGETKLIAKKK